MATASNDPPTFKLVLVGDGGTGKVLSSHLAVFSLFLSFRHRPIAV